MAIGHVKVNQYTLYLCWWLAASCSCSWSSSDLARYSRLTCIHGEGEREGKGDLSVWQSLYRCKQPITTSTNTLQHSVDSLRWQQ